VPFEVVDCCKKKKKKKKKMMMMITTKMMIERLGQEFEGAGFLSVAVGFQQAHCSNKNQESFVLLRNRTR
jgi:hypothetical protein